jgi:glycosyltransferase involved in cell wall biosynthesis
MSKQRVVVISTGRNCGQWVAGCFKSIERQTYPNIEVIAVDDASEDDSWHQIGEWCSSRPNWHAVLRDERYGTTRNQFEALRDFGIVPDDIIVWVDTDDRLAHANAIRRVVAAYDRGALMTYGSYRPVPASRTCAPAQAYPQHVIDAGSYRDFVHHGGGIYWNHLRTISGRIFLALTEDDMKDGDGNWYATAPDGAFMFPALELAGGRHEFIRETLYLYNSANPNSEWRVDPKQINRDHDHQLRVRRPKRPLVDVPEGGVGA